MNLPRMPEILLWSLVSFINGKAKHRLAQLLANFRIREVQINSDIGMYKDKNQEVKTVTRKVKSWRDIDWIMSLFTVPQCQIYYSWGKFLWVLFFWEGLNLKENTFILEKSYTKNKLNSKKGTHTFIKTSHSKKMLVLHVDTYFVNEFYLKLL